MEKIDCPARRETTEGIAVPSKTSMVGNTPGVFARRSDLSFFANHDDQTRLVPSEAIERLVSLYLQAAKEKTAHVALVWPGALSAIPLLHSLACFRLWEDGYKRGVRGLYYPSKRNSFHALNHVFISRSGLVGLANRVFEPCDGSTNEQVHESLRSKDSFLFAVNSQRKELAEASLRPCINELLPHFNQETPAQGWVSYSDHFFFRLKSKLCGRKQATALKQCVFPELGNPQYAPDALFALGHRLPHDSLAGALRTLRKVGLPDVVLIDGSWNSIRSVKGWQQRVVGLIRLLREMFKEHCPGVLVVMDEPRHMSWLQAALLRDNDEPPSRVRLQQHGFVYTAVGLGLEPKTGERCHPVANCRVRVVVTDFEVGDVIDKFYHSAKRLEAQGHDASSLWHVTNFLAKLSHLPGSSMILMNELHRRDAPPSAIGAFDWLHHKVPLLEFMRSGDALDERPLVEELLRKADRLVEAYRNNTPLGLRVESEVQAAFQAGRNVSVVVRNPLHKAVLQSFLVRAGGNARPPHPTAQVVAAGQLAGGVLEGDTLIYADMSAAILRDIVCGTFSGFEMVVALTAPMAWQLKHTLDPLLLMPEFAAFHERLKQVLDDIERQFAGAGASLLQDIEFRQPVFKLTTYEENDASVWDAEAVLVELENGLLLRRGLHSRTYVYDPDRAADGYSGFHPIEVENLQVGQQVFVMSGELRELIEASLHERGFATGKHLEFEEGLRLYHERVRTQANRLFQGNRAAQARMLRDKILRRDARLEPELGNVYHWLNLANSSETPFEELAPQAPRHFNAFRAFCQELRFSDVEIQWFWDFIIRPLRGSRRKNGRWLSDIYSRILFDPDSAIAYMGLSAATINSLRQKALENVFSVLEVVPPEPIVI